MSAILGSSVDWHLKYYYKTGRHGAYLPITTIMLMGVGQAVAVAEVWQCGQLPAHQHQGTDTGMLQQAR